MKSLSSTVVWLFGLLSLSTFPSVRSGVDPYNATTILVNNRYLYNVTHTYFRDSFRSLGVGYKLGRCVQDNPVQSVRYWLNELQLPNKLKYFDQRNNPTLIDEHARVVDAILGLVKQLQQELQLSMARTTRDQYYRAMDSLLLGNDGEYRGMIPVEIHFRSKPYPQSTFVEFVTDRNVVWELYHPQVYNQHAGKDTDLYYRFRHNFRHSLGLGHTDDTRSVMYPTNVRGLALINPTDVDAVHQLLCSRTRLGVLRNDDDEETNAFNERNTTPKNKGVYKLILPRNKGGGEANAREFDFHVDP